MASDEEQMQIMPPEYEPNVLVVMARGSTAGLWRAAGGQISSDELALPQDMVVRLAQWSRAFTAVLNDDAMADRADLLKRYTQEGLAVAREVQAYLGEAYEILFFDEARLEADAYLTDYLYAVTDAAPSS